MSKIDASQSKTPALRRLIETASQADRNAIRDELTKLYVVTPPTPASLHDEAARVGYAQKYGALEGIARVIEHAGV